MSKDQKKPQAFPYSGEGDDMNYSKGMTLRDYFAAKAMQSILYADRVSGIIGVNNYEHRCAEDAYKMADAMLKARGQ